MFPSVVYNPFSGIMNWRWTKMITNAKTAHDETHDKGTRQHEIPRCDLYDLCLEMKWNDVIQHCHDNPADATYQEGDNHETPLYMACMNNPPVVVIRALLRANPSALTVRSRANGDIPLHIACHDNAISIEILKELVQVEPSTASQPTKWGCTPLQALWDGSNVRKDSLRRGSSLFSAKNGDDKDASIFWKKVDILLEAISLHRQVQEGQSTENLFIVRGAVSMGSMSCPYEILQYCIQKYPEQVCLPDGKGRLPLHISIGPTLGKHVCIGDNNKAVHHWSARTKRIRPNEGRSISLLLSLYPAAAHLIDPNEHPARYPLHTALGNKHRWKDGGIEKLLQHAPEVISFIDPVTGLLPYQIPSSRPDDTTLADTDTSFALLRLDPSVIFSMKRRYTKA